MPVTVRVERIIEFEVDIDFDQYEGFDDVDVLTETDRIVDETGAEPVMVRQGRLRALDGAGRWQPVIPETDLHTGTKRWRMGRNTYPSQARAVTAHGTRSWKDAS